MKKLLIGILLFPALCIFAGSWPEKADLLNVLKQEAPKMLKTFRADTGEFGTLPWICTDQNTIYWLSVLWSTESADNPYYHDAKLLNVIAKGGEKLVDEQDANAMWIFRKKDNSTWGPIHMPWTYTRWIQAYLLMKDSLPADSRAKWEKGLQAGYSRIVQYTNGATHNIAAYHAAGTYAAGIAFNREDWKEAARKFMHRLMDRQAPDGYWTEHYGPVVAYNMVYLQALGIYYYYSRDARALDALRKGTRFHAAVLWSDGSSASAIDERNEYSPACRMGNIGFSFTPEGRWYMQKITALQALHPDNAGHLLHMGEVGETKAPLTGSGTYLSEDKKFSMNKAGVYQWCLSAYTCKPNGSRWIMERQNYVEIFHEKHGLIAGGGNTRMQPYFSTFTFGDPNTLQPDFTTTKPNLQPKIPLQWYATQGELSGNTLNLAYGQNQVSVTVTPDGNAINVDYTLKNTPDKPAMAHLQLPRLSGIYSADGKIFPPEQKVVTGKEVNGKLLINSGLIAIIPENAQIRNSLPGFRPYEKYGKGAGRRQVISIPLSPENPTARIRFEETPVPVIPANQTLWNGDMTGIIAIPARGPECKAEYKDGALVVSGKSGPRNSYLVAKVKIRGGMTKGRILKLDFDVPNAGRSDSFYVKGKTAHGKTVFACFRFLPKTGPLSMKIELPLPQCGNGFKLIEKQINAPADAPVELLEFHYAIAAADTERTFSVRNIRLEQPEK